MKMLSAKLLIVAGIALGGRKSPIPGKLLQTHSCPAVAKAAPRTEKTTAGEVLFLEPKKQNTFRKLEMTDELWGIWAAKHKKERLKDAEFKCKQAKIHNDKEFRAKLEGNLNKIFFDIIQTALERTLPKNISYDVKGSKFRQIRQLGEGGFAVVAECEYTAPKDFSRRKIWRKRYAVKMIPKRHKVRAKNEYQRKVYNMELAAAKLQKVVSNTGSPFINKVVKIYDEDPNILYIVMQLGDKDDMFNHVTTPGVIENFVRTQDEHSIKFYAACLVRGIEVMHGKDVAHFDLKLENFLIDPQNGYLQVADFGLSRILKGKTETGFIGTPSYVAPELVRKDRPRYGKEVDWWSFGVLLYTLFTGRMPFRAPCAQAAEYGHDTRKSRCHCGIFKRLCTTDYGRQEKYLNGISFEARDLIRMLLRRKPQERLTNEPKKRWDACQKYARLNKDVKPLKKGAIVEICSDNDFKRSGKSLYVRVRTVKEQYYEKKKAVYTVCVKQADLEQIKIREHPWFQNVDWKKLDRCQYAAPWDPLTNKTQNWNSVSNIPSPKVWVCPPQEGKIFERDVQPYPGLKVRLTNIDYKTDIGKIGIVDRKTIHQGKIYWIVKLSNGVLRGVQRHSLEVL